MLGFVTILVNYYGEFPHNSLIKKFRFHQLHIHNVTEMLILSMSECSLMLQFYVNLWTCVSFEMS